MLKKSDDINILRVIFYSKMTFEKHLRSISRTASQRLIILRKTGRVFHDRLLLERCFWGLKHFSAVWCSAADTQLKLLERVVSGDCSLTGLCLSATLHVVHL